MFATLGYGTKRRWRNRSRPDTFFSGSMIGSLRHGCYRNAVSAYSPGLPAGGGLPWVPSVVPAIYPNGVASIGFPCEQLIPHVPFIELDTMLLEQRSILCFEIKLPMVLFLLLDV